MKKIMNNKLTQWWLSLDSSTQYMYWIIAFCAMLATGIALIVVAAESAYAATLLIPMLLGIGIFVLFFMFVVLWLTIRWPHIRKDMND